MRLHTISPDPLCPGRLLWATFLLAQKHIVQPSSANMQKHLVAQKREGWGGGGGVTSSKLKYLARHRPSSVEIRVFLCRHITHLEGKERQLLKRKREKGADDELVQAPAAFQFIAQ